MKKGKYIDIKEIYSATYPRAVKGRCLTDDEVVRLKDPTVSSELAYKLRSSDCCEAGINFIAEFQYSSEGGTVYATILNKEKFFKNKGKGVTRRVVLNPKTYLPYYRPKTGEEQLTEVNISG